MPSIHTKTITISNGDDIDADPIEQVHTELYENDVNLNDAVNQLQSQIGGTAISANTINESTSGRGVTVDDTLLQDGMIRLASIRAIISSTQTGSAVINSSAHGITTGEPVKYMTAAGVNPDSGLSSSTIYYARSLTSTSFSFHPTAADATANTNPVTVTSASSGRRYLIGAPLVVPTDGKVWIDALGLHMALNGVILDIPTSVFSLLTRFSGTKTPKYASTTTFTVDRISERDSGNNFTIVKSSSTTVDISTTGLNGIAQSGNLSGTITVTAGSTSVTFSASQSSNLIANDVIVTAGGQARKLLSVSGTSGIVESQFSTTETAVAFKRGGRASFYTAATSGTVGTAHYYLYAISDGTTSGLILSTRNVAKGETLLDLPSGYLYSKLLPFAVTLYNISTGTGVYVGNIIPFIVSSGWPYRPLILYSVNITNFSSATTTTGDANILAIGTSSTFASISAANFIPAISKLGFFSITTIGSVASQITDIRPAGSTTIQFSATGYTNVSGQGFCETDSSQAIEYQKASGASGTNIDVRGYVVTETF